MTIIARLSVPQRHARLFARLAALSSDDFATLEHEATVLPKGASYRTTARAFQDAVASTEAAGEELLSAILSLHALHASHGWRLDDIADSVSSSERVELSDGSTRQTLSERIRQLLQIESLRDLAKATDLAAEREHLFHLARIITDVRPVFGDEAEAPPAASVVIQTLRVQYFDTSDGQNRTFEIALSDQDVTKLQAACNRALTKSATIRSVLESAGMVEVDTEAD